MTSVFCRNFRFLGGILASSSSLLFFAVVVESAMDAVSALPGKGTIMFF